jgi:DNA-binding beta-propeller fold protein YncE
LLKPVLSAAAIGLVVSLGVAGAAEAGPPPVPTGRVTEFAAPAGQVRSVLVGKLPQDIVMAPDGKQVYVDNAESHTVTAIGTAGGRGSTRSIHLAGQPVAMAITPNGKFLYVSVATAPVTFAGTGSVAVIKTAGFKLVKIIGINEPDQLASTPNSDVVYVVSAAHAGAETVTPIRTATNRAGKPIPIASYKYRAVSIAATPGGRTVYVLSQNLWSRTGNPSYTGIVTEITTASGKASRPISIGRSPSDLVITPNGKAVYVSLAAGVIPISTAHNRVGGLIHAGVYPDVLAVTPGGKTVFAADQDGSVIPISTGRNVAGAPVAGVSQAAANPGSMAVSRDGSVLYVITTTVGRTSGQVIAVDTATDKASGTPMSVGPDPTQIVLEPNGTTGFVVNNGLG